MEGTRGALLRLAAACCLLCALPGEGGKATETSVTAPFLSTTPTSHQLRETSDLSPDTTAVPERSLGINVTAATFNVSGAHSVEVEDASISATTVAGTEAERLQASTTASPADVPVTHQEHHNVSSPDNSSTDISSPAPTASTPEENQPDHEVTEPFSTTEEMDDANSATPTTPLNSMLATTNSSQLGPSDRQTVGPTEARSETRPATSPVGATEVSTVEPRTSSAPVSTVGSTSSTTASSAITARPPVTSSATSVATSPTSTSTLGHPLEPMHEKASVLDVGDDENPELPSSPLADTTRADPLVITVISVFIVMVGILGLVGFLRYRQHNSRMEFRRLQDLPMDDMMEDTPLSLYSY
ncbi:flocculation protein FLO11-like [Oxyura jamaicensis]|uniref:flocculation protein FLO11-like n=1 Tax=Oxyura jamaicensis TaxID=8884 RepID=UPI0015A5C2ED|nr:flocculation protein FLO11-like [Oxyura jamaicensis]